MTQMQTKFKKTEIGLIPEDWEVVELGELGKVVTGKTPSTSDKENFGGDIPFLKIPNMNSRYENGTNEYISTKGKESVKNLLLPKGSIAVSCIATIGKVCITTKNETLTNQQINSIIPNERVFNLFLYYRLLNFENILSGFGGGGAVFDIISKSKFEKISVSIPPLPEQKAIAEILSSLDDKIELLEKQNKTLENIGQALFKSWFVDFEGFQNDLVESEMGMIPRGWKVGKMGAVLETIESGKRPKGGIDSNLKDGIPSIGAENIIGLGNFEYGKNKLITREFFNTMKTGIIQDYDVLLYKDGASLGRSSMFGNGFPYKECCINEHVFILRTNKKLNQFYLYFWTTIQDNKQAIINLNSNAAQPGINQTSVGSLQIIIPELKILKKYEYIAKNNVDKIFENCLQIQTLSNLRDNLLPRLMSGKIRVV